MSSTERLRMRTKLAFGVGASAEAAVWIGFNTWCFLFYNHVLGLSGTLCGIAVTLSLVIDAISDPAVGYISDRFRSRLGRRHPFLYAAPLPLAASFYCLFAPPSGLHDYALFAWLLFFSVLFRQALTLYQVPHLALGAELSPDYRERSVVMSYNAIFGVLGGAGTFFYGWTRFSHTQGGSGVRAGYPGLAAGVALFSALAIFGSAHFTRDQIPRLAQATGKARFTLRELLRETWGCFSNKNYQMLLPGLVLLALMVGTRETLDSYSNLFFWQLPETKIRLFGLASPPAYVLAFALTGRLHSWFEKRGTIIGAMTITAFAAAGPVLLRVFGVFPPNGSPVLMPVLMLFHALFYTGVAILMISVLSALADVADEHELITGLRQEGVFFASRTLFAKLTAGLGTILAGIAVDVIHFPQGAKPGEVAQEVLFKLGLVNGPISSLPLLFSVFFYMRYRIDKRRHAEIQLALIARRKTNAPAQASDQPVAGATPQPAAS